MLAVPLRSRMSEALVERLRRGYHRVTLVKFYTNFQEVVMLSFTQNFKYVIWLNQKDILEC